MWKIAVAMNSNSSNKILQMAVLNVMLWVG